MKNIFPENIFLILFLAAIISLPSCNPFPHNPDKTVTIEISPIIRESERQKVLAILMGIADNASHSMTVRVDGNTMTVILSPVKDVQAFARRITFGQVDQIEGRTVRVKYGGYKEFI